jgi:hypothetical protein
MSLMKNYSLVELKQLIAARLDIEEIFDILGWSLPEFLDIIEEHIEEAQEEFEDALE